MDVIGFWYIGCYNGHCTSKTNELSAQAHNSGKIFQLTFGILINRCTFAALFSKTTNFLRYAKDEDPLQCEEAIHSDWYRESKA
jgi:hypothetical protein